MSLDEYRIREMADQLMDNQYLIDCICEFIDSAIGRMGGIGVDRMHLVRINNRIEDSSATCLYNPTHVTGHYGQELPDTYTADIDEAFDTAGLGMDAPEERVAVIWSLINDFIVPEWYSTYDTVIEDESEPYVTMVYLVFTW